jgi:ElaB/YqjD/DUF883 family membrane-anchored ribosome-binding protein
VPDGRAGARHYARDMANEDNRQTIEEAEMHGKSSSLERLSRTLREHPVASLAVGAGIGALMGAELLAAGLAGGAAVLLLQRGKLRARARDFVESARDRLGDFDSTASEHHA